MLPKHISLNFVNAILFVSVCVQAASGLGIALTDSRVLIVVHVYNAYLLSLMIVLHLTLNWAWVKSFLSSKHS